MLDKSWLVAELVGLMYILLLRIIYKIVVSDLLVCSCFFLKYLARSRRLISLKSESTWLLEVIW